MDEAGGGGGGGDVHQDENLKAKTSHRAGSSAEASIAGAMSVSTKKTVKTLTSKKLNSRPGPGACPTVYNQPRTSAPTVSGKSGKSVKSNTGMSFGGKSLGADGRACQKQAGMAMPLLTTLVEDSIGGSCAFSQLDQWRDNGLNDRASIDLWAATGCIIEGDLNCRVSSMNRKILVISFELTRTFTDVDEKLDYLLDRINEAYKCRGDRNACLRILQNHSRYISAKANLSNLLGEHRVSYIVEHRITSPFPIDDSLVTKDEDPICYGYCVTEDDETGEVHIHMELKTFGKRFEPVTIDGKAKGGNYAKASPYGKSMLGGSNKSSSQCGMDAIPEHISFGSPHGKHRSVNEDEDDDSTIASQPTLVRREVFRKKTKTDKSTPSSNSSSRNKQPPVQEVDDSDDDESTWDEELMDTEEASQSSEISRLRRQVEELNNIVKGIAQSKSKDSADTTPSTAASTAKKSKKNDGGAASVSGRSRRSVNSRGSARSAGRKKSTENPSSNFFFNPKNGKAD